MIALWRPVHRSVLEMPAQISSLSLLGADLRTLNHGLSEPASISTVTRVTLWDHKDHWSVSARRETRQRRRLPRHGRRRELVDNRSVGFSVVPSILVVRRSFTVGGSLWAEWTALLRLDCPHRKDGSAVFTSSLFLSFGLSCFVSICGSVYVSVFVCLCLSVSLTFSACLGLPVCLSLPACLSLSVGRCLSLYVSVCLPVLFSQSVSVCLSLSVCLCMSVSVCLSLSISVCWCLSLPVYLSVSVCLSLSVSLSLSL